MALCSHKRIVLTYDIARAARSIADAKCKLKQTLRELEEIDTPIPLDRSALRVPAPPMPLNFRLFSPLCGHSPLWTNGLLPPGRQVR